MDWKQIIADLVARGLSQPQIAKACGCSQSTVSALLNGQQAQPRYELGKCLLALHAITPPKEVA